MSSAHQISVDDIDTKMNVLVALSTRLAQQKQEAYTDAATAGGDIEAAFSKIDAEFRKNESRVQSEGLRLSIEKMLVQCLVAATPVWPKAPSVDKLDSDALLESYRQLYSSRIRKMAQELSGPMTLFLHGSSEMETRKGQENLKFVSDKHTKEWEEASKTLEPKLKQLGIDHPPVPDQAAFAAALSAAIERDNQATANLSTQISQKGSNTQQKSS